MAIRGSWLKGWNGDFDQLRIEFPEEQVEQPARKIGEVPEGWTPPTKDEIAKAMGTSQMNFAQVQDRAKQTGEGMR